MKPLPHIYEVKLAGGPKGYAAVAAAGLGELRTAPPPEFDGPGDAWSPEQLLIAAVESCFLFTLRAVAAASKVEFTALELVGQGKLERKEGVTRFTEIVLRPLLTLPAGADAAAAERALDKAKRACFVTASLTATVRMEPEIMVADGGVAS
ncbi:MAG TPA: OsmC family protein [Candidatus Binataceae bacterium]|jgi:organic hydroperoxide reductase OsmC/OhrA|nr:OsmC family protein [Candidatus Binataceae bacterium]